MQSDNGRDLNFPFYLYKVNEMIKCGMCMMTDEIVGQLHQQKYSIYICADCLKRYMIDRNKLYKKRR